MSEENDRRARNAFKNILGGVAGGSIVATQQEYGFLVSVITGMMIFFVTIAGYRAADEIYGSPKADGDSKNTEDG